MKLRVKAVIENVDLLTEFVNEQLEGMDCSMRAMTQIDIALDELFSNICNYAYGGAIGHVTVYVEELEEEGAVRITLEDEGIPFDPLSHADPDITLDLKDRTIGGLGIFMARQSMDEFVYEREGEENVLTFSKGW